VVETDTNVEQGDRLEKPPRSSGISKSSREGGSRSIDPIVRIKIRTRVRRNENHFLESESHHQIQAEQLPRLKPNALQIQSA